MPLTYREITVDDLPATFDVRLSTIENAVTMDELSEDYGVTPESLAEALAEDLRGWLCADGGLVVGHCMGDGATGEVQVLAVRPEYEKRGIGRELLTLTTDWLFEQGFDEIWLLANPDLDIRATGFYAKFGWQRTGEMHGYDEKLTLRRG